MSDVGPRRRLEILHGSIKAPPISQAVRVDADLASDADHWPGRR